MGGMDEEHIKVIYRMDGKLDMVLKGHQEHGERISALESLRDKLIGYSIAIGSVVALAWQYIPKAIAAVLSGH